MAAFEDSINLISPVSSFLATSYSADVYVLLTLGGITKTTSVALYNLINLVTNERRPSLSFGSFV